MEINIISEWKKKLVDRKQKILLFFQTEKLKEKEWPDEIESLERKYWKGKKIL